jgi:hypothetical protein
MGEEGSVAGETLYLCSRREAEHMTCNMNVFEMKRGHHANYRPLFVFGGEFLR